MTAPKPIRVATRRSDLALTQCVQAMESLHKATGLPIEIYPMSSQGDDNPTKALDSFDTKGFFVHDIRQAVLDGDCDIAVHSLKDVPTEPAEGLEITAIPVRANSKDMLVVHSALPGVASIIDLPENAIVGTSSIRRQYQIAELRPDVKFVPVRGNVPTRMKKVEENFDAVIIADAGVSRLKTGAAKLHGVRITKEGLANMPKDFVLKDVVTDASYLAEDGSVTAGAVLQGTQAIADIPVRTYRIPYYHVLPAPGQGAIAIEHRSDDLATKELVSKLSDFDTEISVSFERTVLRSIDGGCSTPLGVFAYVSECNLTVQAYLATPDNSKNAQLRHVYQLQQYGDQIEFAKSFADELQRNLR